MFRRGEHSASMRTGVIQPLPGVGDMIWFLPALQAIAAANGSAIILFAKRSSQAGALLAGEPGIGEVITLPNGRGLTGMPRNLYATWRALRRARLDRIFILHQSPRYKILAHLAGIRDIIAYPSDLACSKEDGWKKSLAFLRRLSIPVPAFHSNLAVLSENRMAVQQRFADRPQPWFIIAAGAADQARRWPSDRFAACADAMSDRLGGTIFLTGALGESACIDAVYNLCRNKDKIVPVTGLAFGHFMGLVMCSKGVLGNCSGAVNVAAAMGKPAYSLQAISHAPAHSPHLLLIKPDLSPEQAEGMNRITVQHALDFIFAKI